MSESSTPVVVCCRQCQGPVMRDAAVCSACGTPVSGKEFPYVLTQSAAPDIPGLFKWWGIWSLAIWVLAGFSFGKASSLLFTGVSAVYLFRIMRAYYR